MFCDEMFIGCEQVSVDDRSRFVIPARTNVEADEHLVMMNTDAGLYLTNAKYYLEDLKRVQDEMLSEYSDENINKCALRILEMQKKVLFDAYVDNKRRINTRMSMQKGVYEVVGFRNGLLINEVKRSK